MLLLDKSGTNKPKHFVKRRLSERFALLIVYDSKQGW